MGARLVRCSLDLASVHSDRAIAGEMSIRQLGASLALGRGVARLSPTGPSNSSLMSGGVPNAMLDVMIELLQRNVPVYDCERGHRRFLRQDGQNTPLTPVSRSIPTIERWSRQVWKIDQS